MCDSVLLMRKYKIKTGTKKHRKDWNLVEKKINLRQSPASAGFTGQSSNFSVGFVS